MLFIKWQYNIYHKPAITVKHSFTFRPLSHKLFVVFLDETPEETSLRDLRGTDTRPTAGSPSPKLSMLFSMGAGPQRNAWWWSPERSYTKRRQNVAYYNLNSFGLRYGKREQNMPVKWGPLSLFKLCILFFEVLYELEMPFHVVFVII